MEHDGWEAEVIREVARRLTEGEMYHYALARARMQSSQACASGVIESSRGRRWDERGGGGYGEEERVRAKHDDNARER